MPKSSNKVPEVPEVPKVVAKSSIQEAKGERQRMDVGKCEQRVLKTYLKSSDNVLTKCCRSNVHSDLLDFV